MYIIMYTLKHVIYRLDKNTVRMKKIVSQGEM